MTLLKFLEIYKGIVRPVRKCRINFRELSGKPHPRIEEPLKFTESRAATWKAQFTRQGTDRVPDIEKPWYQGIVVSLSVAVFMLYFFIFREENDIDEELGKTLYDRIQGLEEAQLQISLKYNREKGLSTQAIEERLLEIERQKIEQNS